MIATALLSPSLVSAEVPVGDESGLSLQAQCLRRNAFCTTDSDCCSSLTCLKSVRIGGHNRCTPLSTCGAFPCGTRQVSVCQYLDNISIFQDTCISPSTVNTLLIHGFGRSHCGPCSQEELLTNMLEQASTSTTSTTSTTTEQSMIPSEFNSSMTPSLAPTTAPSVSGAPSVSPYPTTEWATKDCLVAGDVCTNSVNCCNGGKCYGRMGVRTCTLGPDGETGLGLEIDISGGN
jgi:hypothetical protein